MTLIDGGLAIARIAAEVPGATSVFESLGIDYACAGNLSLDDAAHAAGIAPAIVINDLRKLDVVGHAETWSDRAIAELIEYLVAQHHRFVRDELASIALRLADVCTPPAGVATDMTYLRTTFTHFSQLVLPHLHHEEENVFPVIVALEKSWDAGEPLSMIEGGLRRTLLQLTADHEAIASELRKIRELRLCLSAADDLPPRCTAILGSIAPLEAHFHEYMFLENCILVPRALALDAELTPAASASPLR